MPVHLISKALNISKAELPRTVYAWTIKFVFFAASIMGWTAVTAVTVARLGISFLPYLILFDALFTLCGMFFFTVVAEKMGVKHLLVVGSLLSILTLAGAVFFYNDNLVFLLSVLAANGIFLSQTTIFLSNFIEEHFTPQEAERTFPIIESSETVGGIFAGFFLAFFGLRLMGRDIFLIWIGLIVVFTILVVFIRPKFPFYFEVTHCEEKDSKHTGVMNSLSRSLEQIKNIPFLQVLIAVLVVNWVISIFIDFQFTKAVNESLHGHGDVADHEKLLTHGLGTLHLFLHGSALLFELILAGRLIKKLGSFGSFLVHAILTFLGVLTGMVTGGIFPAILMKHNFLITGKLQKSAYENMYYAYPNHSQKAIREFLEGFVYPLSCIIGTGAIIFIEFLFLKEHFYQAGQLFMIFAATAMLLFTVQIRKKYTRLNIRNLDSEDRETYTRAVNILVQKGHGKTIEILLKKYTESNNVHLRDLIIRNLSLIKSKRSVNALIEIYPLSSPDERLSIIFSLLALKKKIYGKKILEKKTIEILKKEAKETVSKADLATITEALAVFERKDIRMYVQDVNPALRAKALKKIWKEGNERFFIKKIIREIKSKGERGDLWVLPYLADRIKCREINDFVHETVDHPDNEIRTIGLLTGVISGKHRHIAALGKMLLFGEEGIYVKAAEVISVMSENIKRQIAKSILPHDFMKELPDTVYAKIIAGRLRKLYEICEADDEMNYMHYNVYRFENVTC